MTWKTTTSFLFAGIVIGGCTPKAPLTEPIGTGPTARHATRVSFLRANVTPKRAEYEWEIRTDRSWRSGELKGGTATLCDPIDGKPETRHIRIILEAVHHANGRMDVTYTHVDAHRSPHANGEAWTLKVFNGIPIQPLESLVTLGLTKPTEVKMASLTRLAELRFPASQAAKRGVKPRAATVPIEIIFRDKPTTPHALDGTPAEVSFKDW